MEASSSALPAGHQHLFILSKKTAELCLKIKSQYPMGGLAAFWISEEQCFPVLVAGFVHSTVCMYLLDGF